MPEMLLAHLLFSAWCVFNAFFDAYLIFEEKRIAHGVNGGMAAMVAWFISYKTHMPVGEAFVFYFACLWARQLSFDIPLNLRRGLSAFYQSVANPPKAIVDKIERALFGHITGKQIAMIYAGLLLISTTGHLIIHNLIK